MDKIFIGYDEREAEVMHVCIQSIIEKSSRPVSIVPLSLNSLQGVYEEAHSDGSNAFIYSRFLAPYLCGFQGRALFIDGDMVLRTDIMELFDLFDDNKAVQVVKHDYKTRQPIKYMGSKNEDYPRKNWSSVILWNCSHQQNKCLTPEFIKTSTGKFLHRFSWLEDELVGGLPITWNWLPDEFGERADANLLHYTLGAPCFVEYVDTPMASEYIINKMKMLRVDRF
ncbi:hypothetical protein OAA80_00930 [Amylibacter sp.]|jgi:lipopolysaccharide biosynthesis glycosyltransferase|nr:hypothetical protein [Amylibacter sp.]